MADYPIPVGRSPSGGKCSWVGYLNVEDYHRRARERLSQQAYDYYASGAHDEKTLKRNREAFDEIALYYRVMRDVSNRSLDVELFGSRLSMPILVAPTAFHGMASEAGEVDTARAAAQAETVMVLSTLSNKPMEQVAEAATAGLWFQLYCYRDREATEALVERAERAGASAIVLTVDAPLLGCREADVRNRFRLPSGLSVVNMTAAGLNQLPEDTEDSGLAAYFASLIDPGLTWADLSWLRSVTRLPILVKGIVRADDARRAVDSGADGIVVSNHGGRQLDTSPATVTALAAVAASLPKDFPLLLDGGVRRGTDVIKALALGAKAVLLGRPILWGLAAEGAAGVAGVLELFRRELDLGLALCGCARVDELGPWLLSPDSES